MSRLFSYLLLTATFLLSGVYCAIAQGPLKQWDKTVGGSDSDELTVVQQTSDGGYILGGYSMSGSGGDKSQASQGLTDYWIVKLDASGTKQWDRTFGGALFDVLTGLQQTSDGGYVLGGSSNSGLGGDKTQASQGLNDYWVIKLDASGTKQWDHTFGGSGSEEMRALQQTSDGGYILGGSSDSPISGDKTQASLGRGDYWLVKLTANGSKQWDRTVGGSLDEHFNSLQQTSDGGYILGGQSVSGISGDKTQSSQGQQDYWIVRLNASGVKQWDRTFGGSNDEILTVVQQTSDGGYILGGYSSSGSGGDKTQANQGRQDYWVVKLAASGTKQWDRTFGGNNTDELYTLQQASDGGYTLGGISFSGLTGDKTQPNLGMNDYWLVKLDAGGTKRWDRTFGGSGPDRLNSLQQTSDSGYILGGHSASGISGDKTQANQGNTDYWLIKLGPETPPLPSVTITGDSVLCPGVLGQLSAVVSTTASTYSWNTGATTASIAVSQSGTYSVQVAYPGGFLATASYQVRRRSLPCATSPTVTIIGDSLLCAGLPGQLTAVGSSTAASGYRWNTGATSNSIVVNQSGTYSVQVAYPGGFLAMASYRVQVKPCSNAPTALLIPNIITPNGDGRNDRFRIQGLIGTGWQLHVYNRWGRQVYQNSNYQHEWGTDAAPGLYYFVLQGNTTYKGWLEVVK